MIHVRTNSYVLMQQQSSFSSSPTKLNVSLVVGIAALDSNGIMQCGHLQVSQHSSMPAAFVLVCGHAVTAVGRLNRSVKVMGLLVSIMLGFNSKHACGTM